MFPSQNEAELIEALIEYKADVAHTNDDGDTALVIAAANGADRSDASVARDH